jgi:hypothetical protein
LDAGLILHYFPGVGWPDDLPCGEFDRLAGLACRVENFKRGGEDDKADERRSLLDALKALAGRR